LFNLVGEPPANSGFVLVCSLNGIDAGADEAIVEFGAGDAGEKTRQPILQLPDQVRRDLMNFVNRMGPETALTWIECLGSVSRRSSERSSVKSLLDLLWRTTFERLTTSIQNTTPRYSLHIDQAIAVADQGIFLIGWFNAESALAISVTLRCDHYKFSLSENWSRYDRPDVTAFLAASNVQTPDHRHGFSCYVPLPCAGAPCLVSVEAGSHPLRQMRLPSPKRFESTLQLIRTIMSSFLPDAPDLRSRLDRHIGPAISAAWKARPNERIKENTRSYGPPPDNPTVSIIVPLYGRHDFAEYQLALFAGDPEFRSVELIYVVDDPRIFAEFSAACPGLYGMYEIPFVVASSAVNLGFSGANNFAAARARAPYLLFLNSDVFPKQSGWVSHLLHTYQSLYNPGALGVKLLYEDGSLQHAGMAFRRYPGWSDLWINDHPKKGLSPITINGIQEIDAVTAACVLVESTVFHKIGGFSEDYIVGDFEDSDLCLRLVEAGRTNYITLDIELFHLERQSQNKTGDSAWRTNLTLYNCWLFNKRWSTWIEARERTMHS
jgi:GT2 family glycosyltransferase